MTPAETTAPPPPLPWYRHLYFQVIVAILIGVALGQFAPKFAVALKPLGDGFVKLVRMIIAPVIFLTIVSGIAHLRELGALGRIAAKAFAYFLFFSTVALIIGLIVANVIQPGAGMHIDPATLDTKKIADFAAKAHDRTVTGFLLGIIPETMLSALSGGDILQVLLVAILTGVAISLVGEKAQPVVDLVEAASAVGFRVTAILMRAAPIGALGAMAFTIGQYGIGALASLLGLVATFYLTSLSIP